MTLIQKTFYIRLLCTVLVVLSGSSVFAEVTSSATEQKWPYVQENKISPLSVVLDIPNTSWETLKFGFQRDSVPVWMGLIASTAVLYRYDGDIYDWAAGQGRRWNIGNADNTKTVASLGSIPLMRLPSDTGSTLYFLGDGWTHGAIAAGFLGYGYFSDHSRPLNTGMEIVHGMIISTVFNQILKHATGRESPNKRTEERGAWRPFPSINAYSKNTSKFDAFPSGHIMTATLVFTTIRQNYPEYDHYILPVQILWSAALMYQMMNNGVHWASDYPLGIAMGWAVAKMAVKMGQPKNGSGKTAQNSSWTFFPTVDPSGEAQINAIRYF